MQGESQDSVELADGRLLHRWVDAGQDPVPEEFVPFHARSVSLSAPKEGVCCRIDLLEGDGESVTPIEYKRGKAHESPAGWYDPQMIQLAAQGQTVGDADAIFEKREARKSDLVSQGVGIGRGKGEAANPGSFGLLKRQSPALLRLCKGN